jgi:hypothetical protein
VLGMRKRQEIVTGQKMEGHCSAGQSLQRTVVPSVEGGGEEEEETRPNVLICKLRVRVSQIGLRGTCCSHKGNEARQGGKKL